MFRSDSDSGPEPLKEIMARLFTARGWGRRQGRLHLERAWASACGPDYATHSRVLNLRRGIFEVEVDIAVLLQELAAYHKRRLLQELNAKLPGHNIKELRFRAASRNPSTKSEERSTKEEKQP